MPQEGGPWNRTPVRTLPEHHNLWGLATALKVLEFPARSIIEETNRLVLQIDPNFAMTKKKRLAARPAGLSFGQDE
jgi:hypothetical protein